MPIAVIRETARLYILEVLGIEVQWWEKSEPATKTAYALRDQINEAAARGDRKQPADMAAD